MSLLSLDDLIYLALFASLTCWLNFSEANIQTSSARERCIVIHISSEFEEAFLNYAICSYSFSATGYCIFHSYSRNMSACSQTFVTSQSGIDAQRLRRYRYVRLNLSISVIQGRWVRGRRRGNDKGLCAIETHLQSKGIPPHAGLKPKTATLTGKRLAHYVLGHQFRKVLVFRLKPDSSQLILKLLVFGSMKILRWFYMATHVAWHVPCKMCHFNGTSLMKHV